MNKLIVISGLNGIGKSTAVKNLMLSSNCEIVTILHDNKKLSLTIDETSKTVALGDYIKKYQISWYRSICTKCRHSFCHRLFNEKLLWLRHFNGKYSTL